MIGVELEYAIELMLENTKGISEVETIPVENANGYILASNLYAPINNPPFHRSPLDGYAVLHHDTVGALKEHPVKLKVVGEVFAGQESTACVTPASAVRIMTGAKMPKGATCVIRQEDTDYGEVHVNIYKELKEYENFCFMGEDIKENSLLMSKGEKINYVHQGILASMGIHEVLVYRKPRIAMLVTGDEVTKPGSELVSGKIYDSNLYLIKARLLELGMLPIVTEWVQDDKSQVAARIREFAHKVDFIITTGGVSVGKKDILHDALSELEAKRIFWKVNLKPGTPAIFSLYQDKPILSLSGNPFAAIATFELLARPVLAKLCQDDSLNVVIREGIMKEEFRKKSPGRRFIRAKYEDGFVTLSHGGHSSGMLASMIGCNCMIDIAPGNEGLYSGDKVRIVKVY